MTSPRDGDDERARARARHRLDANVPGESRLRLGAVGTRRRGTDSGGGSDAALGASADLRHRRLRHRNGAGDVERLRVRARVAGRAAGRALRVAVRVVERVVPAVRGAVVVEDEVGEAVGETGDLEGQRKREHLHQDEQAAESALARRRQARALLVLGCAGAADHGLPTGCAMRRPRQCPRTGRRRRYTAGIGSRRGGAAEAWRALLFVRPCDRMLAGNSCVDAQRLRKMARAPPGPCRARAGAIPCTLLHRKRAPRVDSASGLRCQSP